MFFYQDRPMPLYLAITLTLGVLFFLIFSSCGRVHAPHKIRAYIAASDPTVNYNLIMPVSKTIEDNHRWYWNPFYPKTDTDMQALQSNYRRSKKTKTTSNSDFFDQYSKKFGIMLDGSENKELIMAIDNWLGTPYRNGGCSYEGIDCSCLVKSIYNDVYGIELSRTSETIFSNDLQPIPTDELREGDLVCFKIRSRSISHIGIYLKDNKFIHASLYRGVVIDDLNRPYYKRTFYAAGRVKNTPEVAMTRNPSGNSSEN